MRYARQHNDTPLPHSITHLQLVNPKEFPRFKQLGVIASVQLLWATAESYTEELVKPYVSAYAYRFQYPARSLHKAGATIAGASDWPVSSPNRGTPSPRPSNSTTSSPWPSPRASKATTATAASCRPWATPPPSST